MRKNRNYWNRENSFEAALKFNNKKDFKKCYAAAYELLRTNGWLNEACSHMENIGCVIKWTYEKCKEEALKCETKVEFKKNNSWGYTVAKQKGWLDEITSHTVKHKHVQPIYWTFEKCQFEALKFKKRIDFYKNSSNAYGACVRNGWLNDVCGHMGPSHSCQFKWTIEEIRLIALKYNYRKEFQNGNKNEYSAARYNGWLDEICQHMQYKKLPNKYWHSFENCKAEALKYKYRSDFIKNSQHTYNVSLKYGWIDDICKHMIVVGNRYSRCIYSYEFPDNHVYVGLTYNIEAREMGRNRDETDAVTIYINKTKLTPIRKQLTNYIPVKEAVEMEKYFLKEYVDNGWIALNRRKTGTIGGASSVWNFKRIKKITSKYKDLKTFVDSDIELFEIAKKSGWINSLFPNEI